MSSPFEIDYDVEAVWLDDAWFTRDELAGRIKQMIEAGDFRLSRPSAALERLEAAIGQARVLAARVSPEVAEAVERAAEASGRPIGAVIREALTQWLTHQQSGQQANQQAAAAQEEHIPIDDPEMEKSLLAR